MEAKGRGVQILAGTRVCAITPDSDSDNGFLVAVFSFLYSLSSVGDGPPGFPVCLC